LDDIQLNESDDIEDKIKELKDKKVKLKVKNSDLKEKPRKINAIIYE